MVNDEEKFNDVNLVMVMKYSFKYMFATLCAFLCVTGCDDKLEVFETNGSAVAPVAFDISKVEVESLPGAIQLTWPATEEGFAYMKVRYNDPLQKKEICRLLSNNATGLLIENTRARFGDYVFSFQTFNAAHEGGSITEVKAQSGPAPATLTEKSRTKVVLTDDQFSTDNQEPSEGPIKNLNDGNVNTFFHTRWSQPQVDLPQYIQIDFKEEHENFAIKYTTRSTSNTDGYPTSADLQISADGEVWETVASLVGLPATSATDYSSDFVAPGEKFKHFRFSVTTSSQNKKYFHMSEFSFYDVDVEVYDPETVALD